MAAVDCPAQKYCLSGGQLAGVIFASIFATSMLLGAAFFAVLYWRRRYLPGAKSRTESNNVNYVAYDNQQFDDIDGTGGRTPKTDRYNDRGCGGESGTEDGLFRTTQKQRQKQEKEPNDSEFRSKRKRPSVFGSWWSQQAVTTGKSGQVRCLSSESLNSVNEILRVTLQSKDINGLGMNICGNLRDGIYVKSLANRGVASDCGRVCEGDRILSLTVNFENIAFEDALTILSYASAYPIALQLQRATGNAISMASAAIASPIGTDSIWPISPKQPQFHPLLKSQSIDDIVSLYAAPFAHHQPTSTSSSQSQTTSRRVSPPNVLAATTTALSSDDRGKLPSVTVAQSQTKSQPQQPRPVCSLEVVEETPQMERRSPMSRRAFDEDAASLASSSLSGADCPRNESRQSQTMTVTAEINSLIKDVLATPDERPSRDDIDDATSPVSPPTTTTTGDNDDDDEQLPSPRPPGDPYAGLSYEERLQIIRLSYEDPELSRSTPNLSNQCSDAEDHRRSAVTVGQQNGCESPTSKSRIPIPKSRRTEQQQQQQQQQQQSQKQQQPGQPNYYQRRANSGDSSGASSMASSVDSARLTARLTSGDQRQASLSDSSVGTGEDSDRVSSPEQPHCVRPEDDDERQQYQKLLYFQQQLARQHEELTGFGIHVPAAAVNALPASKPKRKSPNEYTSA